MRGRKETENHYREVMKNLLEDKPIVFKDYYVWLTKMEGLEESTATKYIRDVLLLFEFMDKELEYDMSLSIPELFNKLAIKKSNIQRFMVSGDVGASYANGRKASISKFYDFLMDDSGEIPFNPCKNIQQIKNKNKKVKIPLEKSEIQTLLYYASNPSEMNSLSATEKKKYMDYVSMWTLFIELAYTTGSRCGAITEICIEDIDFDRKIIHTIQKGNKAFDICYSDTVAEALKTWLKDRKRILSSNGKESPYLFFWPLNFKKLDNRKCNLVLKDFGFRLKRDVTMHDFRHTCGTDLYEHCRDINQVAQVLGHSNIQTTQIYAHVSDRIKRESVTIMDEMLSEKLNIKKRV